MLRLSASIFVVITACLWSTSFQHYVYGPGRGMMQFLNPWLGSQLVPDILDRPPLADLRVVFNRSTEVNYGAELTPTQVQDKPLYLWWFCNFQKFYTLVFVDPDAPNRENATLRSFQHWIVGNIPGCLVDQGETLTEYIGSGPGPGSGFHRYVYLVYMQPEKLDFDETFIPDTAAAGRPMFDVRSFANKYRLFLFAGNFYRAQYDDYVPTLYRQLGIA